MRLTLLLAGLLAGLLWLAPAPAPAAPIGAQRAAVLAPSHDPDALALRRSVVAAGATMSDAQLGRIDRLNRALKASTVWYSLDRLWVFASPNSTQARRDLITRSVANPTNGPTFTANRGYTGDGLTSYIDLGYTAGTDAVRYTLNSASLFAYVNTTRAGVDDINIMGAYDATQVTAIQLRRASNNSIGAVNIAVAGTYASGAVTDTLGLFTASRTASNLTTLYKRAASLGTSSQVSLAFPTVAFFGLALNTGGGAAAFETRRCAALGIGGGLSAALVSALNAALEIYFSAIGANA